MIVLKTCFALLCLLPALSFAAGISLPNDSITTGKAEKLEATPVFQFLTDTATHHVGNRIAVFAHANYSFGPKGELAPEFYVDGALFNPIQTTASMWVFSLAPYSEPNFHVIGVKVYTRDAKQAGRLREGIAKNDAELASIADALAHETDPAKISKLQQQQSEKQAYRTYLQNQLSEIRVLVKTEAFLIYVAAASQSNF